MTITKRNDNSFLVRIWWEQEDAAADTPPIWRGWVQHIRSGEKAYVQDLKELLDFIERWTGPLGPASDWIAPSGGR